jgi:hypothetical protein
LLTIFFVPTVDPIIHFGALEAEKPSDAMDGQPALFDPPIHGIGADAEILRNLMHASPAVLHDRLLCLVLRSKAENSLSERMRKDEGLLMICRRFALRACLPGIAVYDGSFDRQQPTCQNRKQRLSRFPKWILRKASCSTRRNKTARREI